MYSIVYTSRTGNPALLARTLRRCLPEEACRYFGPPVPEIPETPLVLAGFWTDKGACSADMADFLAGLAGKRVFLFGTAGFGGAPAYFDQILSRVKAHLPPEAAVAGTFMCQGKMPQAVRDRYAAMEDSPRRTAMLENFDRALSHPDEEDLQRLRAAVTA